MRISYVNIKCPTCVVGQVYTKINLLSELNYKKLCLKYCTYC